MTEKQLRGAIATLMVVVAVDVLGLLLIIPIVDTFAQSLGASKALIGTQFTVYSASSIFASLVVGRLSDYYGRKRIFLISAIGAFISAVACIFVQNFDQFLAASAFNGLFTGTVGTAYAYVGDLVSDEAQRRKYISYITATISLCLVLGPLVGGSVATLYLRAPFFISAGIALLEVVLVVFCLQNPDELKTIKENDAFSALLTPEDRALLHPPRRNRHGQQPQDSDDINDHSITSYRVHTVSLDNAVSMKAVEGPVEAGSLDSQHARMLAATEILRQVATLPDVDQQTMSSPLHHPKANITSTTPMSPPLSLDQSASLVTVIVEDDEDPRLSSVEAALLKAKSQKHQSFPYFKASKQALSSLLSPSKSLSASRSLQSDSAAEGDSRNKSRALSTSRSGGNGLGSEAASADARNKSIDSSKRPVGDSGDDSDADDAASENRSPWCDYRALLIGGLGTFLNVATYLGLVTLVPLILQEPQYGVVSSSLGAESSPSVLWSAWSLMSSGDDDELSSSDIRHISFLMGAYLGCYGAMQVLGMLFVFPYMSQPHRCGLLGTAVIGCLLYGGMFCTIPILLQQYPREASKGLFAVVIGMAFGNAMCRPVFPTFLNQIAPAARRAEYMTFSGTFSNVALMIGGQMTWLYAYQGATITIILCGGASLLNALIIALYAWWARPPPAAGDYKGVKTADESTEADAMA